MSEADQLNHEFGLPEAVGSGATSIAPAVVADPSDSAEWQTVDFPGAMSVDEIPAAEADLAAHSTSDAIARAAMAMEIANDLAVVIERLQGENTALRQQITELEVGSVAIAPSESADPAAIAQLQTENSALRQQLKQLEEDLTQKQIDLQLETARQTHTDPADTLQELATTRDRLDRLFEELEAANQTTQRQQILADTLTKQIEDSQERIAQLERDCAVTQQRLNEQIQQRLQAESSCRDLRMRLHRQQQQTLQFKVALEKSLEMSSFRQPAAEPEAAPARSVAAPQPAEVPNVSPKSQPVQPWATGQASPTSPLTKPFVTAPDSESTTIQPSEVTVPLVAPEPELASETAIEELQAPDRVADLPAAAASDPQRLGELLNQMFPQVVEAAASAVQPTSAHPIFDLSPFFASEATVLEPDDIAEDFAAAEPSDTLAESAPVEPPVAADAAASAPPDPLCHNLAAQVAPAAALSEAAPSAIDPIQPDHLPRAIPAMTLELPPQSKALEALNFPNLGLKQPLQESAVPPANQPPLFSNHFPSPVLYPARSQKKRKSLAAVELPTFPRPQLG